MQNRYVKMALGINSNTPNYIWRMETGTYRLETGNMRRASKYLLEIEEYA